MTPSGPDPVRRRRRAALPLAALTSVLALTSLATPAKAEIVLEGLFGKSWSHRSDVDIRQKRSSNDYTFHDVAFDDESFTSPLWYGARVGYFLDGHPWLGVAIDYFHFKIIGQTSETRHLTGTRLGAPVDTRVPMDSIVQQFRVTHGVNYFMLDLLARHGLLRDAQRFPQGRIQLYAGVGLGPVVTHAENRVDGIKSEVGYRVGGVGVQGLLGVRAMIFRYLGVFAEYKFTHSDLSVDVAGGDADVSENTHHLVGGVTVVVPAFWR